MAMPGKQLATDVTTSTTAPGAPLPASQILKLAAADSKTTNALLLVVVLCMSGFMPEQLTTLCGV